MLALYAEEPKKTVLRTDYPIPVTKANGVRLQVKMTTVGKNLRGMLAGDYFAPLLPFPYIPGPSAIGIVDDIGSEVVSDLQKGELAMCVPTIGSSPHGILQGGFHFGTELSKKLSSLWRDGTLAEYAVYPSHNVIPLRGERLKKLPLEQLAVIPYLAISFGAIKTGNVRAGQVVVIGGATGRLGFGCVLSALALGVSKIYAMGRNKAMLKFLAEYDPRIVVLGQADGQSNEDYLNHVKATVRGSADVYIDAMGNITTTDWTEAGIATLKARGTAVFLGGVKANVPINYMTAIMMQLTIKGSFMSDTDEDIPELLALIESGSLKLDWVAAKVFSLKQWTEAVDSAAQEDDSRTVTVFGF